MKKFQGRLNVKCQSFDDSNERKFQGKISPHMIACHLKFNHISKSGVVADTFVEDSQEALSSSSEEELESGTKSSIHSLSQATDPSESENEESLASGMRYSISAYQILPYSYSISCCFFKI